MMDTQQILTSLASLRDNLSAIETARQQVQKNVAAYDMVRQQLADTSTDISKILDDFTSLISFAEETERFQKQIDNLTEKFHKELSAQLNRLTASVNDYIGKYKSLDQDLKRQIDELSYNNDALKAAIASLETSIDDKINELLPGLSSLIDRVTIEIDNSKTEIKSCQTQTRSDIETSSKMLQEKMEEAKSQNSRTRVILIVGFVVMSLPILMILAKVFSFI